MEDQADPLAQFGLNAIDLEMGQSELQTGLRRWGKVTSGEAAREDGASPRAWQMETWDVAGGPSSGIFFPPKLK
jgi:hypothetical protein